jgi:hypothetical protein
LLFNPPFPQNHRTVLKLHPAHHLHTDPVANVEPVEAAWCTHAYPLLLSYMLGDWPGAETGHASWRHQPLHNVSAGILAPHAISQVSIFLPSFLPY